MCESRVSQLPTRVGLFIKFFKIVSVDNCMWRYGKFRKCLALQCPYNHIDCTLPYFLGKKCRYRTDFSAVGQTRHKGSAFSAHRKNRYVLVKLSGSFCYRNSGVIIDP